MFSGILSLSVGTYVSGITIYHNAPVSSMRGLQGGIVLLLCPNIAFDKQGKPESSETTTNRSKR